MRTTRRFGYVISQVERKLVEEVFGWGKSVGASLKPHQRGHARVGWLFRFAAAMYNVVRIRTPTHVGIAT